MLLFCTIFCVLQFFWFSSSWWLILSQTFKAFVCKSQKHCIIMHEFIRTLIIMFTNRIRKALKLKSFGFFISWYLVYTTPKEFEINIYSSILTHSSVQFNKCTTASSFAKRICTWNVQSEFILSNNINSDWTFYNILMQNT